MNDQLDFDNEPFDYGYQLAAARGIVDGCVCGLAIWGILASCAAITWMLFEAFK